MPQYARVTNSTGTDASEAVAIESNTEEMKQPETSTELFSKLLEVGIYLFVSRAIFLPTQDYHLIKSLPSSLTHIDRISLYATNIGGSVVYNVGSTSEWKLRKLKLRQWKLSIYVVHDRTHALI